MANLVESLLLFISYSTLCGASIQSECAALTNSFFVDSTCVVTNTTTVFDPSTAFTQSCNHLIGHHAHAYWPRSATVHQAIAGNLPAYAKWMGLWRKNQTDASGRDGWYFVDGDGAEYGPLGTLDPDSSILEPPFIMDTPITWDDGTVNRFARLRDYTHGLNYAIAFDEPGSFALMGRLDVMNVEDIHVLCQYDESLKSRLATATMTMQFTSYPGSRWVFDKMQLVGDGVSWIACALKCYQSGLPCAWFSYSTSDRKCYSAYSEYEESATNIVADTQFTSYVKL